MNPFSPTGDLHTNLMEDLTQSPLVFTGGFNVIFVGLFEELDIFYSSFHRKYCNKLQRCHQHVSYHLPLCVQRYFGNPL